MKMYQMKTIQFEALKSAVLKKAKGILTNREKVIRECIEDESQIYFERLDFIYNKHVKEFCAQAICSVIGSAYDFFYYIRGDHNIFYQNIKLLNSDMGKKFYKWSSMYDGITFATTCRDNQEQICRGLALVFAWTADDKALFEAYVDMRSECDAQFEVEFAKDMTRSIFGEVPANPVVLALTGNLFYNSYKEFLCELGVSV